MADSSELPFQHLPGNTEEILESVKTLPAGQYMKPGHMYKK